MRILFLASFVLFAATAFAKDKTPKTYAEHGTVVSVQARGVSSGMILAPGQGFPMIGISPATYRVETTERVYTLSDRSRKPSLAVGQIVEFRIEKDTAWVKQENGKERKYRIMGVELRTEKH
jgi:hypothetical protein